MEPIQIFQTVSEGVFSETRIQRGGALCVGPGQKEDRWVLRVPTRNALLQTLKRAG
jgi:hypothetical protein